MKRFSLLLCGMALGLLISFNHCARASDQVNPIYDVQQGFLLGGSQNGKWLLDKQVAPLLTGKEQYRVWKFNTQLGRTTGTLPEVFDGPNDGPCPDTFWLNLRRNFNGEVAFGAQWNPVPRPFKALSVNLVFYRDEVARLLRHNDIPKAVVKINRLWRGDLDGDGTQEVLIEASNYKHTSYGSPFPSSRADDYSFIVLRQIVNGRVKTIFLASEFYTAAKTFSAPSEFTLVGVYDLNGDGRMEIVFRDRYYEGIGTSVVEVKNGTPTQVLCSGCGA